MGPPLLPALPESLVRKLLSEGRGVGLVESVPAVWRGRKWHGTGTPIPALVESITEALRNEAQLPSISLLDAWPALEASALRALDATAPVCIVAVLHADDPVFPESSQGALSNTMDSVSDWARQHGAELHVGPSKTVGMVFADPCVNEQVSAAAPITIKTVDRSDDTSPRVRKIALTWTTAHTWLGVRLTRALDFSAGLEATLQAANAALSPLVGLLIARAIPLHLAVALVEAKVDSLVACSRWLYAVGPGALDRLNDARESWSRLLLGADSWRNGTVCTSELGWDISGRGLGVIAVALRRKRMWTLPGDDLYRIVFCLADAGDVGWAAASKRLLEEWGIADSRHCANMSYDGYKSHVKQRVRAAEAPMWLAAVERHGAQVPYPVFQRKPSDAVNAVRLLCSGPTPLDWDVQVGLRSWCRLRAGLLRLRARGGKRSDAKYQDCIFCGRCIRNATKHALAECAYWATWREAITAARPSFASLGADAFTKAVLECQPSSSAFPHIVRLADAIDRAAGSFWKGLVLL